MKNNSQIITLDRIKGFKLDLSNSPIKNLDNFFISRNIIFEIIERIRKLEVLFRHTDIETYIIMSAKEDDKSSVNCNKYNYVKSKLIMDVHQLSIMLINYVRTIGMLMFLQKNEFELKDLLDDRSKNQMSKRFIKEYIESVIPKVLLWRNKVSAHYSATDPKSIDDILTLENSMITTLEYNNKRFWVSTIDFDFKDNSINFGKGAGYGSTNIPFWSPTAEFEKLAERYWIDKSESTNNKRYYKLNSLYFEFGSTMNTIRSLFELSIQTERFYKDILVKLHVLLKLNHGLLWLLLENIGETDIVVDKTEKSFESIYKDLDIIEFIPGRSILFKELVIKLGAIESTTNPNYVYTKEEIDLWKYLEDNKVLFLDSISYLLVLIGQIETKILGKYYTFSDSDLQKPVSMLLPPLYY